VAVLAAEVAAQAHGHLRVVLDAYMDNADKLLRLDRESRLLLSAVAVWIDETRSQLEHRHESRWEMARRIMRSQFADDDIS
jgi:hypothetical protein